MMVGVVNFDMGVSPPETLRLVSSEGLAPLPIPFSQNSFSGSFHEMMSDGNASQQDSALLRNAMKSISAAMDGNAKADETIDEEEKKGLTGYKGLKGIADSTILQGKAVAEASLQDKAVIEAPLQAKPVAEASLHGTPVVGTPEVRVVAEASDVKVAKLAQETSLPGSAAVYENLQINQNPVNPVNPVKNPLAQNLAMEPTAEEEKKGLTGFTGLKGIADSAILQAKPVAEASLQGKTVAEASLQGKPVVGTPEVKIAAEASGVKVAKLAQETAIPVGAAVYENLQINQNPVNPVNPVQNPLAQNLAMEAAAEEKGLTGYKGLKGIADSIILQGKSVAEASLQGKPVAEASLNATPVADATLQAKAVIEAALQGKPVAEASLNVAPVAETPLQGKPVAEASLNATPVAEASLNVAPVADATLNAMPVAETTLQTKTVIEATLNAMPVAEATLQGKPVAGTPEVRVVAEAPDVKVAKIAQETAIPGGAAVYENLQKFQNPVNPVNPVQNPLAQNLAMEAAAEEERKGLTGYKGLKGIADSPILQGKTVAEASLQGKTVAEASLQGKTVAEASLNATPVADATLQTKTVIEAALQGKPVTEATLQGKPVAEATLQGKTVVGTPEVRVVAEASDVKVAKLAQETSLPGGAAVYENLQVNQNPVNPVNPVKNPLAQNLAMEAAAEEKKGLPGFTGLKGIADSAILQTKPVAEATLQTKPVIEATLQGKPVAEVSLNATPVAEATLQSKPVAEASLPAKPVAETSLEGTPVAEADEVKVANPVKTTQARNSLKEPVGDPDEEIRLVAPHAAPIANVVMADAAPVSELAQAFAASAASAQTEAIAESVAKTVELVNQVVEAVAEKISVTPTLAQGEGEILITLKPDVLDGSEIHLAAKAGELTVSITPATVESAQIAQQNLQRLEIALAEHAPSFHHVAVVMASVKKGRTNETA